MMASTLERSTLEAYGGIALAIFIAVVPLHWQMQCLLLVVVVIIAADVTRRGRWFYQWKASSKFLLWLITVFIIGVVAWNPVREQYRKDQLPLSIEEQQKIGQELGDLSNQISQFIIDRASKAPRVDPEHLPETAESNRLYFIETGTVAQQRFGAQVRTDLLRLKSFGIDAPWSVASSFSFEPEKTAKWLGTIGRLLAMGRLQDAISMGGDDKLWFTLLN